MGEFDSAEQDPDLSPNLSAVIDELRRDFEERLSVLRRRFASEIESAAETARQESRASEESDGGLDPIVDLTRALDQAGSQADILGTLVEGAGRFASRAIFFVRNDDVLTPWGSLGFDDSEDRVAEAERSASDLPAVEHCLSGAGSIAIDDEARAGWIGDAGEGAVEALLVPFVLRGQVAGALYADRSDGGPWSADGLRLLAWLGARAVEGRAARNGHTAGPWGAAETPAVPAPPEPAAAEPTPAEPAAVEPTPAASEEPELVEARPAEPDVEEDRPLLSPATDDVDVETLAETATDEGDEKEAADPAATQFIQQRVEPPEAPSAERQAESAEAAEEGDESSEGEAPSDTVDVHLAELDTSEVESEEAPAETGATGEDSESALEAEGYRRPEPTDDEEDHSHDLSTVAIPTPDFSRPRPSAPEPEDDSSEVRPPEDLQGPGWAFGSTGSDSESEEARRLARLLVTEIKLYNQDKLAEGRASGDVYSALRDDIDRSRRIFKERMGDDEGLFDEALVQILADGDPDLIGG